MQRLGNEHLILSGSKYSENVFEAEMAVLFYRGDRPATVGRTIRIMEFNELNSVEHFFIHRLTSVNLNETKSESEEPTPSYGDCKWRYVPGELLKRDITEVLLENELKESLCRLNPDIKRNSENADEVIRKLRAILITVANVGLVRANEEFAKWLRNEHSLPFGPDGEHIKIKLIDYKKSKNNSFILTNQFKIHARETKIPDLVLFLNGIPVVVGELKTPVRPAVSWYDAAHEVHDIYENTVPQLFVPNILSFASEGKELFIGAIRTPLEFWAPWRIEDEKNELHQFAGLQDVAHQLTHLLKPSTLLDILQYYSVYGTDNSKKKVKVVCRYQQYEGANAIVQRVLEGRIKKGLIWHFQGSGKSLLMLFASQKLRKQPELGNPTVLIVIDRTDLDSQITSSFASADISNFVTTNSIKELNSLLERDTRKIIITMIHKFRDAYPDMNKRENIIVMVDEAHRTQEGNLGRAMCAALPNAFLFGLTGTPINKVDKNTFWAFGAEEDEGGYMSRYTFQDSIRDKATLPLHFEPRLPNYHIDKEALNTAFQEMTNDLSEADQNKLSQKAAKMNAFLKAPERVQTIVEDIADHYKWLSQVYTSVKPPSDDNGRLLWHALGVQTTALIHEHIHVAGINHDMEEMVLDAEVIEELMNNAPVRKFLCQQKSREPALRHQRLIRVHPRSSAVC